MDFNTAVQRTRKLQQACDRVDATEPDGAQRVEMNRITEAVKRRYEAIAESNLDDDAVCKAAEAL